MNLYHRGLPALLGAVRDLRGDCLGDGALDHSGGSSRVAAATLVTSGASPSRTGLARCFCTLTSASAVIALPEEKRIRFAELFLEMVPLWDQDGEARQNGGEPT